MWLILHWTLANPSCELREHANSNSVDLSLGLWLFFKARRFRRLLLFLGGWLTYRACRHGLRTEDWKRNPYTIQHNWEQSGAKRDSNCDFTFITKNAVYRWWFHAGILKCTRNFTWRFNNYRLRYRLRLSFQLLFFIYKFLKPFAALCSVVPSLIFTTSATGSLLELFDGGLRWCKPIWV